MEIILHHTQLLHECFPQPPVLPYRIFLSTQGNENVVQEEIYLWLILRQIVVPKTWQQPAQFRKLRYKTL
ncbi:UNVERIFIED_CONTAM: hypothetical protein NCL1_45283 [Trichonephila clavipes]